MKKWINGATVIITGASSGIGRELSKKLILENNCHVIGVGRNKERMENLLEELGDKSEKFEYRLFDVSSQNEWKKFADELQSRDIDVLINNAGILPPFQSFDKAIYSYDDDKKILEENLLNKFMSTMKINFESVVLGCAYISPIIEKSSRPAIINVSSSSGLCALPGISIYAASKSAVKSFTESIASEKKYYVGLVLPGFTKTDIFRNQNHSSENKLIDMISTSLNKMTKKIHKGIIRKRKRMVLGFDAKMMNFLYRLCPKTSTPLLRNILRSAGIELFKDVFEDQKGDEK